MSSGSCASKDRNKWYQNWYRKLKSDPARYAAFLLASRAKGEKHRVSKEGKAQSAARQRAERLDKLRVYHLKRTYGLSPAGYAKMLADQNGVCAICRCVDKGRRLSVDHNHSSGRVRGLLCWKCNDMLGQAKDDPKRLLKAIRYLLGNEDVNRRLA